MAEAEALSLGGDCGGAQLGALAPLVQGHPGEGAELAPPLGPSRAVGSLGLVPEEIYCLELEPRAHIPHEARVPGSRVSHGYWVSVRPRSEKPCSLSHLRVIGLTEQRCPLTQR